MYTLLMNTSKAMWKVLSSCGWAAHTHHVGCWTSCITTGMQKHLMPCFGATVTVILDSLRKCIFGHSPGPWDILKILWVLRLQTSIFHFPSCKSEKAQNLEDNLDLFFPRPLNVYWLKKGKINGSFI